MAAFVHSNKMAAAELPVGFRLRNAVVSMSIAYRAGLLGQTLPFGHWASCRAVVAATVTVAAAALEAANVVAVAVDDGDLW